ncbi:type IV secretory system conjugative DNA transfer family protein [Tissierella praeacuta]|uniref:type IV secretory system conjugative DNA transfer family protein n=1 Tax=Tissierella praeacuta TaxID=43131 RepID=UPI0028AE67E7|nr:hypothetical protein [Tissierella praeacuta]
MEILNSLVQYLKYGSLGLSYYLTLKFALEFSNTCGGDNQTLKDLLKHIYVIGQTGTGKTTFILNRVHEYKKYGSVVFICYKDQKTAHELLDTFNDEEKDRVVYIDPTYSNNKIGFNMFGDSRSSIKNELYINSMIDTYKTLWGDSIGASSEDIFRMIGLGVAEMKIRTPLEIYKCLVEEFEEYRILVEKTTKNPIVKNFFTHELPKKVTNHSVINPPKNKQRRIVGSPILLSTLCQSNPKFNLEKEVNDRKIIIVNFNQEKLGAENASFLASLFFSQLQIIGFTRKNKSVPIFVIADEFQDYINDSFETFLSQARAFNMSLTLAHQYKSQVPPKIQNAIDGNVASRYYFRVGKADAKELSVFLDEGIEKDKLVNMKDYHYLREIIVDGKKQPMKIKKAPKPQETFSNRDYIMNNSAAKHGVSKREIDLDIRRRFGEVEDKVNDLGGIII